MPLVLQSSLQRPSLSSLLISPSPPPPSPIYPVITLATFCNYLLYLYFWYWCLVSVSLIQWMLREVGLCLVGHHMTLLSKTVTVIHKELGKYLLNEKNNEWLLANSLMKLSATVFQGLILSWIFSYFSDCASSDSTSSSCLLQTFSSLALFPDTLSPFPHPLLIPPPHAPCSHYPLCSSNSNLFRFQPCLLSDARSTLPMSTWHLHLDAIQHSKISMSNSEITARPPASVSKGHHLPSHSNSNSELQSLHLSWSPGLICNKNQEDPLYLACLMGWSWKPTGTQGEGPGHYPESFCLFTHESSNGWHREHRSIDRILGQRLGKNDICLIKKGSIFQRQFYWPVGGKKTSEQSD